MYVWIACCYAILLVLATCGGEGPTPPPGPVIQSEVLYWDPPKVYTDGSPIAGVDIMRYDIYVSEFQGFTEDDLVASVAGGVLNFDLKNLRPQGISPVDGGSLVSVKVVMESGVASDFSVPILWENKQ